MTFQLDTSGHVSLNINGGVDPDWTNETAWTFASLSPFAQGYVEALLRSAAQAEVATRARMDGQERFAREVEAGAWDETNRADIAALARFDRLAPETLARIIADCETAAGRLLDNTESGGKAFWRMRQHGDYVGGLFVWKPLTVQLGEDGRMRFA